MGKEDLYQVAGLASTSAYEYEELAPDFGPEAERVLADATDRYLAVGQAGIAPDLRPGIRL